MCNIADYILAHIDAEPDYLHRLWRATNLELLNGRMASGHLQGRLLKMLVEMVRPRNILEVGTFSGYSALCMAEGLADDDCRVYTFEVNDEVEDFTRRWIAGSPYGHRVQFTIGDALQLAPALGITFDMAFLDGAVSSWPITPCGTGTSQILPTTATTRRRVSVASIITWLLMRVLIK